MLQPAIDYHGKFKGEALIVERGGKIVHESYARPLTADTPHALYSGTKSFWGIAALEAQSEGLLELDETVAATVPSWQEDPWKKRVTLRQLLQLIAGLPFGGLGSAVPAYDRAIATELRDEPGTVFTYGGIPLQIFGVVFARKLAHLGLTPGEYLRSRILDPSGIHVARWRVLKDGTQPLPTGAFLTARNWLSYGRRMMEQHERYAEAFSGSKANTRYGLGWWLAFPGTPKDLFYASGSGGQALYVIPSLQLTAVRFGGGGSFNHALFVKKLAAD